MNGEEWDTFWFKFIMIYEKGFLHHGYGVVVMM
jgi:hypothetical protein